MSAYLDTMAIFSDGSFREGIELWMGPELLKKDRETFAVPLDKDLRISDGRLKLLVGHAANLIAAMSCFTKCTEDEMRNAYRYLFVCMNCQKYRLDPKAAKVALNIEEYEKKYWRKQA